MGPNTLLTVPGRRTGLPRSAAVAVVEVEGRRWVVGTFGEVNWVRNLRSAGEAVLGAGGRSQRFTAIELGPKEAETFFRHVLLPYVRGMPLLGRMFVMRLARDVLDDPAGAASSRPVFELRP